MSEQTAVDLARAEALAEEVDALEAESPAVLDVATAQRELDDATEEAEEAEQLAADLEGRLSEGDVDVDQRELEAARGRAGFLSRRLAGFRTRVQRAQAGQRERAVQELTAELMAFADDASLDEARRMYAQAVLAAGKVRELVTQREQRRAVLAGRVEALEAPQLRRWVASRLDSEQVAEWLGEEIRMGAWPDGGMLRHPSHVMQDPQVVAERLRRHEVNLERIEAQRAEQMAAAEAERMAKLQPGALEPADAPMYRVYG